MTQEPQRKRVRPTVDLEAPGPKNFEDVWMSDFPSTEEELLRPEALFGTNRSWFVRATYVRLYNEIMEDGVHLTQIVNGTAGIGKSSFLLYMLARLRFSGKPVLLHYHRDANSVQKAVFFPADGRRPQSILASNNDYQTTFEAWYESIGEHKSVFLVDGIVSFIKDDVEGVKYVAAKSPSCSIGFMEKDQNRCDRWLDFWSRTELLAYANLSSITNAEDVIDDNMYHIGGIPRYAFQPKAAQEAIVNATFLVGAKELLKVVTTHLTSKYDEQKVVDRLLHRHPPPSGIGVQGTTFTFASEFVATRVSMTLALETNIDTAHLLNAYKGVGAAGSMRGVLFEAYSARKLAVGGLFTVKEIGSETEAALDLLPTTILQKDTKILNKANYPADEIVEKVVWPNPDHNMPAIDVFMVRSQKCMAFQMTVATSHGLDVKGTKAFLKYFDSISRELHQAVPQQYPLYFVVPKDVFDRFSNVNQPITGANGVVLTNADSTSIGNRLQQFIMKIE
jgi:hypothetical protein